MKTGTLLLLLLLATSAGCRRAATPQQKDALNTPASRAEALALMNAVEHEGIEHGWPPNVARQVRCSMLNRLMSAGLKKKDIEEWIAASDNPSNRTEYTEGQ